MKELGEKLRELDSRLSAYKVALQVMADAIGPTCQGALSEAAKDVAAVSMRLLEDERQLDIVRETLRQIAEPLKRPAG
jgi:hypothetical protein